MEELLLRHRCDPDAVRRIFGVLKFWRSRNALKGLPISLEASSALGNFYLESLDRRLMEAGARHVRYMDDIFLAAEAEPVRAALVDIIDEHLTALGLQRSIPKTHYFDDPRRAIAHVRNTALSYLGGLLTHRPVLGRNALRHAFDILLSPNREPNVAELHFILTALGRINSAYGCRDLARSPMVMNLDPKAAVKYLELAIGHSSLPEVIDACMEKLLQAPKHHYEALDLHILRFLGKTRAGHAESEQFLRIATDLKRPWPIRNFAWHAYARAGDGRGTVLMEAAREEREPNVRRALVAGLRYVKSGKRILRNFLHRTARRYPECRCTAEWVRVAA
jgi:hypothetical protein